jgi:hypothetical protein
MVLKSCVVSDDIFADDDEGIVTVESIDISPDPPQPGKEMTVTVNGANSKVIEVYTNLFEASCRNMKLIYDLPSRRVPMRTST